MKYKSIKIFLNLVIISLLIYFCILRKPKVVIIGSYKKCWKEMMIKRDELVSSGHEVLAPIKSIKIGDPNADFVILKADGNKTPKELQDAVNLKIASLKWYLGDFVMILNLRYCNGQDLQEYWTGHSTDFEYGYAYALGKKIICLNKPSTLNHQFYCNYPNK